jgi:hypothetical protein
LSNYTVDAETEWLLSRWKKRSFTLLQPPSIEREFAQEVVSRVAALYQEAHSCDPDPTLLKNALQDWSNNPIRSPRRLIRGVIERLDQSRVLISSIS